MKPTVTLRGEIRVFNAKIQAFEEALARNVNEAGKVFFRTDNYRGKFRSKRELHKIELESRVNILREREAMRQIIDREYEFNKLQTIVSHKEEILEEYIKHVNKIEQSEKVEQELQTVYGYLATEESKLKEI